jgi:hypothetical protein
MMVGDVELRMDDVIDVELSEVFCVQLLTRLSVR